MRRSAVGSAPSSASVLVLNSMTSGWSISYTVGARRATPAGRRANPGPTPGSPPAGCPPSVALDERTRRRTWSAPPCCRSSAACRPTHCRCRGPPARSSPVTRRVKKSTPTARTSGSANGSLISGSSAVGGHRAGRRHHGGRRPDARCQIPRVVIACVPSDDPCRLVHSRYLGDVTSRTADCTLRI